MAEITLRAYIKIIDDLIDQQNLDEAISHCRRILESYPKHLETYRLLGKSYLEAKRYGDAADIFQRVLSAAPDDFVSHIGMAIIREDEGNLDSAIWHMERAFETNPANPAIQQELRRLIGNRDGIEPAKVRMTRGALARMYAHGELYSQAIAELRAALQEDPERPDLQVMLASMYWRTNQYPEAADVSNQILEKLPYCRDANRITASVLRANNKTDEASAYHRRLAGIDPYMAFVDDASVDPESIDDSSVKLDRLEWSPGQPMPSTEPGKPSWAASLGVKLGDTDSGTLKKTPSKPSWLEELGKSTQKATSDMNQESDSPPPFPTEDPSESAPPETEEGPSAEEKPTDSQIPEWMSEAGWTESTGEVQERPLAFSDDELDALEAGVLPSSSSAAGAEDKTDEDGELTPAEIPSWMQDIAPDESAQQDPSTLPDWLGDIAADMSDVAPSPKDVTPPILDDPAVEMKPELEEARSQQGAADDEDESGSIPGWLGAQEPGATSTIITWLGDRESKELKDKKISFEDAEEKPASDGIADQSEVALPEWFDGSQEPASAEIGPMESTTPEGPDPSVLADLAEVAAQQSEASDSPQESTPAEAQSLSPQDDFDLPTSDSLSDDLPATDTPDWLQNIAAPDSVELSRADIPLAELEDEGDLNEAMQIESAEAPSWLKNLSEPEVNKEQIPQAGTLQEITDESEIDLPTPSSGKPPDDDTLDWLSDLDSKEVETPISETNQVDIAAEQVEPLATLDSTQTEAEMDWLSDIGEPGSDRVSSAMESAPMQESPDWLSDIDEPTTEGIAEEIQPQEETPDWLEGIAEPDSEEFKISSREEETIDWLKEIATDELEQKPTPAVERPIKEEKLVDTGSLKAFADEVAAADTTDLKDDEVFDWLEDLAATQPDVEQETAPASQGWQTADIPGMESPPEQIVEDRHIPEEPQQGLDWLEDLAAQRGLDVDVGLETSIEPVAQEELAQDPTPQEAIPVEPEQHIEPVMEVAPVEPVEEKPVADVPIDDRREIEETTDWLDRMATQPLKLFEAESEDEAPDWLLEVADSPTTPDAPTRVSHSRMDVGEVEDISASTESIEAIDDGGPKQPESPPLYRDPDTDIEIEIPDWLRPSADEVPPPSPPVREEIAQEPVAEHQIEQVAETEPALEEPPGMMEPQVEFEQPEPKPELIPDQPILEEIALITPVEQEVSIQDSIPEEEETGITETVQELGEPPAMEAVEPEMRVEPEPELEPDTVSKPEPEAKLEPEPAPEPEHEAKLEPEPAPEPVPEPELEATLEPEPVPEPKVEPTRASKEKVKRLKPSEVLDLARQAFATDDIEQAKLHYTELIKRKKELKAVIEDINMALEREPAAPDLWQLLGDAYMKDDQLQEAIKAYQRGTEVA